jgi:nitrite reductase/ring-hydroxylating ferredoxin subunit
MRACQLSGRETLLCHTRDGFFALDSVCTHAHARTTDGRLRGSRRICPLPGACFDVRDARVLARPASRLTAGMIEIAIVPGFPPPDV